MPKSKKRDRNDLSKDTVKYLDKIFAIAGEENRMKYIASVVIIQTVSYMMLRKSVDISIINRWFINEYLPSFLTKDNIIDFDYIKIASDYLQRKKLINFNNVEQMLLQRLNDVEIKYSKEQFHNWQEYCEYMINFGLDDRTNDKVYKWIKFNINGASL